MNATPSSAVGTGLTDSPSFARAMEFGGRFLMAAFFFIAGIRKLQNFEGTVGYFTKLGLPLPEITLVGVLVIEMVGAALLVLGWRTRIVALALALFTISAALIGHQFWNADPAQVNNQVNHFLKVVGLLGGLLHIAAFANRRSSENA